MNTITVLFFATLRDQAGTRQLELPWPEAVSVADLRGRLSRELPGLAAALPSAVVAVNREFATSETLIPPGAEVAFFPPVSGGSEQPPASELPTIYAITEEPLDLDELLQRITLADSGAAAIFTGMVRGVTRRDQPHQTRYLEYEAYRPMAEAKLRQVAAEIRERWPSVQGIALVQRIGRLYPGTPTVLIACTAAHRDTGVFEAARYGIDRLKEIVPIWKKEVGPNGEQWVEGEYYPHAGE